ncbi:DUF4832 domain-containing protein [Scytonema sp. UIC 10036]|nr:DUF4832 domain-containing protein [Scytonema sp. UIC 10036]
MVFSCVAITCQASAKKAIVYQGSNEIFPNPERGFMAVSSPVGNVPAPPLNLYNLQKLKSRNITLVRRIYLIEEFRHKPLSESFLNMISEDFETAREARVKLILRFTYNWRGGGDDAPKKRILSHLEQLKPIFKANYDVIAYMEAGFIGYWGEWSNISRYGLRENPEARREILFKALSVLPPERMVALRYTHYKRDAFNNENPLTPNEAFNESYRARTGAHNDCFLADIDDWGTYSSTDPQEVDKQKSFLNLDNRFVVQGGEVCNPSPYDDCPNTLQELAQMRWSVLNEDVYDGREILQDWETQGCMAEIKRRLGYRFRLLKSEIPEIVKSGETFSMKFEITNDGWASPYNPRDVEIVLRNRETGNEYYLPVNDDPRMWMPGEIKIVKIVGSIPQTIPIGEYQVFLNLADPTPRLNKLPEYSIRLANKNVWEESTGYNSLLTSIMIEQNSVKREYSGDTFFKPRN